MEQSTIICCAEISDPRWRWIESSVAPFGIKLEFARCLPGAIFIKTSYLNLARVRGSFEAVQMARRTGARAIVPHGPTLAAWCALFSRIFGLKIPILAHTFNFTTLPSLAKRIVFTFALSRVDRFVVFSTMERELYARAFKLPTDRFDVVYWGVRPPEVEKPSIPFENGDYISAIGGNARDYRTLLEAARILPDIRFVLVVRPGSLRGLNPPSNVTVHTSLPLGTTMNVLLHSRFMVLPLSGSEVPCGHVTLVAAMHLGKALVITDSSGVGDYVRDGDNALTVPPGSVEKLAAATRQLWENPALCVRLGENGRRFASLECNEERTAEHFLGWLLSKGFIKMMRGSNAAE